MNNANQTKIGLLTATIIGMNAMIGSGIFTAPAAVAANVGPAGIVAYLFVVVAVWFMAQSLGRLAYLFPQEGSFYAYARQWGGHAVGMLAGGMYVVGLTIAMGLLTQIIGGYLHTLIPSVSAHILGLIALIALVVLNLFGAVLSQLGQHILIVCTTFPLVAMTIMCLFKADVSNLTPFAPFGWANVIKAMRIAIFGFFGFECAASLFNIVHNPKQNVPKALTYSIAIVGSLYTLFVGSIILSVPLENFTDPRIPLSDILESVFPGMSWFVMVIHFAILSALIGTVHSMIWSASALLVSLKKKAGITITHNSGVLAIGALILLSYLTLKQPGLFFNLTAIGVVSAFILSMITLLTIKEEWRSGNNIKTVIGMGTALLILALAVEGVLTSFGIVPEGYLDQFLIWPLKMFGI